MICLILQKLGTVLPLLTFCLFASTKCCLISLVRFLILVFSESSGCLLILIGILLLASIYQPILKFIQFKFELYSTLGFRSWFKQTFKKLTEQVILLFLSFIPSSRNIKIRGIYTYKNLCGAW